MTSERVAVIGAGPAGSVTAYRLAEAGVPVDLIDAALFPREKACGDLLGTGTVEALADLGLGRVLDGGHRIDGERFFDSSDRCVHQTDVGASASASPVALPRFDLDAALRDAASDAGATLIRAKCTAISAPGATGRTLTLAAADGRASDRTYRFVVGADGARSSTARRVGLHPGLAADHAVTIRRYVSTEMELSRQLWFFVPDDEATATAGPAYCWAFPVAERRLNIGVYACAPAAGRNLASRLDAFQGRLCAHLGSGAALVDQSPVRGGIVRYDFDPSRVTADGIALVGDAAGLAHAIVGEGILYAVTSGSLLADAIIDNAADGTIESTVADAFDAAFTSIVHAARTAAHHGLSVIGGPGATFGGDPAPSDSTDHERTDLLARVVRQAMASDHDAGLRAARRDRTGVSRRWTDPGRDTVRIPAHRAVRFELVGGGGAGGHWQGGSGGNAPRLFGTISSRDTAWELQVWCGQGGGVDTTVADEVPSLGGRGGGGFVAGGDGGWGSGNGAGGGGGGGGASALRSEDGAVLIVSPGGGGGGGGGPVDRVGGDGDRRDGPPRNSASVTAEPGGNGDYGVTRGGLRGGGGGGGGGGCPGGAGGAGGSGGDGGAGGVEGAAATVGADPDAVRIEVVGTKGPTDDPGAGGRGGATAADVADAEAGSFGTPGRDGVAALWW